MTQERIYNAIILNEPYASKVKDGIKIIETRMRLLKNLVGDFVFCCDKGLSKYSKNAGNALYIVTVAPGRMMTDVDAVGACIENAIGRYAYDLSNLRHFSYDFKFTDYAVVPEGKKNANWQGIFKVRIPHFVQIKQVTI